MIQVSHLTMLSLPHLCPWVEVCLRATQTLYVSQASLRMMPRRSGASGSMLPTVNGLSNHAAGGRGSRSHRSNNQSRPSTAGTGTTASVSGTTVPERSGSVPPHRQAAGQEMTSPQTRGKCMLCDVSGQQDTALSEGVGVFALVLLTCLLCGSAALADEGISMMTHAAVLHCCMHGSSSAALTTQASLISCIHSAEEDSEAWM